MEKKGQGRQILEIPMTVLWLQYEERVRTTLVNVTSVAKKGAFSQKRDHSFETFSEISVLNARK